MIGCLDSFSLFVGQMIGVALLIPMALATRWKMTGRPPWRWK